MRPSWELRQPSTLISKGKLVFLSVFFSLIFLICHSESPASQLRLSWSDNSDNEEGFEIQRMSPGAGFVSVAIVGTNTTGYADGNLAAGATYCYRVRAFNGEGISDFSNLGCATTPTTVSVSKFGSGAGTVLSDPPGIHCGADCREPYALGTVVTLAASPADGSVFAGWSGAVCAGTGSCIFNAATDLSVTAVFDLAHPENAPPPADPPPSAPIPAPLTLTGLAADLASPQFVGTAVTFTAAAAGGVAPLEFKWWIFNGSLWRVARDWDASHIFVFNPPNPGAYAIGLWARSMGNGSDRPENDAALVRSFSMMPRSCPAGQFLAEFFANPSLSGSPIFTDCDRSIGYSWFWGDVNSVIDGANFSVRWTGRFPFSAGVHEFVATADDGIRAWIDGKLIIDGWIDQASTTHQVSFDLSAGEHNVQVDYYQNGGDALTHFYWHRVVTGNDDFFVTLENSNLTVEAPGVLGNDSNFGAAPLTATLVSGAPNGTVLLNLDGSFSYTPNPQFNGTDSFTYRADNGSAAGNLATVTITVTPVNDVPIASNDAYVVMEDNSLVIGAPGVLGNDNDLDGTPLTAVLLSSTSNGTLSFNSDGSFSYTPHPNFNGTDSFTYLASDGGNESNVAMVTLTVTGFNDIPVAQNDAYETIAGLTAVAPGVLANDMDADNDPLTALLVTPPLFGTVTLNPDGSFVYQPLANFIGADSFSYKASDGNSDSNVAMVTIAVIPPPVVVPPPAPTVQVSRAGSGSGSVLSSPAGIDCGADCAEPFATGVVVMLEATPADGSIFAGWSGACAGTAACIFNVGANVSVTALFDAIDPENNPPPPPLALAGLVADLTSPQSVGTAVTFTASASGGAAPLEFKWWVQDASGWRVQQDWSANHAFVFAPAQPGSYVIAVWARSAENQIDAPENEAMLSQAFTVAPLSCPAAQYLAEFFNNMNFAGSPTFSTCQGAIDFNWANGGPAPGVSSDHFSARWTGRFPFSAGIHEFVATAGDGIRVRLDGELIIDGWFDQAATTYRASLDISAGEHVVQVEYYENGGDTMALLSWHRAITSNDDFFVTLENSSLTVEAPGVLGNDSNFGAAPLTATLVSGAANGTVLLNLDGSFSYTPNPQFNGTDSFTYRADNGSTTGNLATVTIAVTPINDVPIASNDVYVVMEDSSLVVSAPGVLGNDNDLEGNPLTALLLSTTNNGTLNFNPDGSFSYTPNPNFNGTDSFTYLANDGENSSNVAMVTLTVTALNDAPVAQNDSYQISNGGNLFVVAPGVLANDIDPEGDPMATILVSAPLFGSLTLNADGSFEYVPLPNFSGTDSFTYKTTDGGADSNVAMVTITVGPPAVP
jgi:VCBS repeat-containing protein